MLVVVDIECHFITVDGDIGFHLVRPACTKFRTHSERCAQIGFCGGDKSIDSFGVGSRWLAVNIGFYPLSDDLLGNFEVDFLPSHFLLYSGAVSVLAQGGPNHLIAAEGFYFPPLAQFVLVLILPASGEQRAVYEVVLEIARGHSLPLPSIILAVVAVSAVREKLQSRISIVIGLDTCQSRALPQAEDWLSVVNGDQMVWKALRQKEDGSTSVQKMTWKKIDLNVAEKIIGKWMATDIDGQTTPTNMKSVYTFVSTTKAYMSASFKHIQATGTPWHQNTEADVAISGNKVTLTMQKDEHNRSVQELTVTAINNNEFTASLKVNVTVDGNVVHSDEHIFHFTKLVTDYKADIVGTWQGHCTSAGSIFDDGQEHRWQYNADGTYVYYVKDGDNWVPYEGNTLNEYFVDGNRLCTRWIDLGQENREWWEITINGNKMNWTALRQNPDGTTFTATFEMTKVVE